MGRPRKDAFDEDTTVRVLRAAEEAFGRDGFRRARLEDIAEGAGIRRPSLLYHFHSKEKLYRAVLDRAVHDLGAEVQRAMAEARETGRPVDSIATRFVDFARERNRLMTLILRALLAEDPVEHEVAAQAVDALVTSVERVFKGAYTDAIPEWLPLRHAFMQIFSSWLLQSAMGGRAQRLWGEGESTRLLARALLLREVPADT